MPEVNDLPLRPGTLVIQFRSDTAAFDGHAFEKEAAIKVVLGEAMTLIKGLDDDEAEALFSRPDNANRLPLHDANCKRVGVMVHVATADDVPTSLFARSSVRLEFNLDALYRHRAPAVHGLRQGAAAVVLRESVRKEVLRQLADFQHDVGKLAEVAYQDPVVGASGGVVSTFKRLVRVAPVAEKSVEAACQRDLGEGAARG